MTNLSKSVKAKIYITQRDNDKYFRQKLPTFRSGFCYIERVVTFSPDPHQVYGEDEYGYILIAGSKVEVCGDSSGFEIVE